MSIQMTQSAASIAALSSNATLVNLSETQAATFKLNSSTMTAQLHANDAVAESDSKAILDAANASQAEAIGSFGGAIAGGFTTITGVFKGIGAGNEAQTLEESLNSNKLKVTSTPVVKAGPDVEGETTLTGQNLKTVETEETVVNTNTTGKLTEAEQTEDTQTRSRAESLRSKGKMFYETASTLGGMVSTVGSSTGKLVGYNYQIDQGKQTKIKDTENGVASTLNTLASLIGQQLGNLDQNRASIYQMMQGMAVRQG